MLARATHHRIVVLSAFRIDTAMPMIFGRPSWLAGVVLQQVATKKRRHKLVTSFHSSRCFLKITFLKHDLTAPTNELVGRESFPEEPAAASGRKRHAGSDKRGLRQRGKNFAGGSLVASHKLGMLGKTHREGHRTEVISEARQVYT